MLLVFTRKEKKKLPLINLFILFIQQNLIALKAVFTSSDCSIVW